MISQDQNKSSQNQYPYCHVALSYFSSALLPYKIPEKMQPMLKIGMRVQVPFGSTMRIGFVVAWCDQVTMPDQKVRPIDKVLESYSQITPGLIALGHWMSQYYHVPFVQLLMRCIPSYLCRHEQMPAMAGYVCVAYDAPILKRLSVAQENCLKILDSSAISIEALDAMGIGYRTISGLLKKGQLKPAEAPLYGTKQRAYGLNASQQQAIDTMTTHQGYGCFVLAGVTGSGKTAVYCEMIDRVLKSGRQALMLVPEIGLTPQTVQRFQAQLPVELAVMHSRLSEAQRAVIWDRVARRSVDLVIGTRSALFLPFFDLGIVILDEEHDSAYHQQSGIRYGAREMAVLRAKQSNGQCILGSATPSIESLHNVAMGKYRLLLMPERVNRYAMPTIQLVDMRALPKQQALAPQTLDIIKETITNQRQVLCFLNRRGFAPVLFCHQCGWGAKCVDCDVTLHYHQSLNSLLCHHCQFKQPLPQCCPQCQTPDLIKVGMGTERLEDTLTTLLGSSVPIVRVDRDTTQKKGALDKMMAQISKLDGAVLLGTQMLAKGHHFEKVDCVVILEVDSYLYSSDFRAQERIAQTLWQVAGRAGRAGQEAKVLIQTHYPSHPLFQDLIHGQYLDFAEKERVLRTQFGLPPSTHMALIRVESLERYKGHDWLQAMVLDKAEWQHPEVIVLGPLLASIARVSKRYRWQIVLTCDKRGPLHQCLAALKPWFDPIMRHKHSRLIVDVDPQEIH